MRGLHILRVRQENFFMHDFEVLTMLISALEWRKHNGEITLITDNAGYDYLKNLNLLSAYDNVEVYLDEMTNLNINEDVFWAGGKLFALLRQTAPICIIDLDFILWQKLNFEEFGKNIAVIHREDNGGFVYPDKDYFKFKNEFNFPDNLDWNIRPCNGAFVYFGSNEFIKEYADFAIKFMQNADESFDRLCYMVFIEQRFMSMCAKKLNLNIYEFSNLGDLFNPKQKYFTHIWGYKQKLRDNLNDAENFCRKCVKRLRFDFEEFLKINEIPIVKKY